MSPCCNYYFSERPFNMCNSSTQIFKTLEVPSVVPAHSPIAFGVGASISCEVGVVELLLEFVMSGSRNSVLIFS